MKCKTLAMHRGKIIVKSDSKISDILLLRKQKVKTSYEIIELKLKPSLATYPNS
jgi:hypothetical protein